MRVALFIDKHIVANKRCLALCFFVGSICAVVSLLSIPCSQTELYIEGIISTYVDNSRHVHHHKGGEYDIVDCYIIVNNTKIRIPYNEVESFRDKGERYCKQLLEGKYAKVYYLDWGGFYTKVKLEDGSYSYHDPRDISSYDVGWFPFCITAPIALFCIYVYLRLFYLEVFVSDERRELVFGNKDGNLH